MLGFLDENGRAMGGTSTIDRPASKSTRYAPQMIIAAGCAIAMLTFGPRAASGVFQLPILASRPWSTDTFSFAMAIQYLLWGAGQPIGGMIADRFGSRMVLCGGTVLYAAGLMLTAIASSALAFDMTAGVLAGLGLSGCSFSMVIAAFSKLLPENKRAIAFGLGTAAGSFGQFLFLPLAGALVGGLGWQASTVIFGLMMLIVLPLSAIVATQPLERTPKQEAPQQSLRQAFAQAFGHRSYLLLVIGFFTCGFQLAFITVHFQRYVVESGLAPSVGYWAFALVGLFNMAGSVLSGYVSARAPRRFVLSFIYLSRALVTLAFISLPPAAFTTYVFGALSGFLWLSTVPPTSSLIGTMFGTRYFSTLYGMAFFSHQLGGFTGLVLAGVLRQDTGSYLPVWWLSIGLGVFSALINLPIVEKPAPLAATVPA